MSIIYTISGISRQGYFQRVAREEQEVLLWQRLKETIMEIRKDYPRVSARKIHRMLHLEGVVGVNRFERFISDQGLALQKQRSLIKTTKSGKFHHPNLVNGIKINGVNQLWVSDITYFITPEEVFYIVLILDVYSRRILGYSASDNLMAINNLKTLKMAFMTRGRHRYENLIHHSDKGSQYGSAEYETILHDADIVISMAKTCMENPYAERINGIIKNDFLIGYDINTLKQLEKALSTSINLYNTCPHGELGMLSPMEFEAFLSQISQEQHPVMQLYDFTKSKAENIKMGFKRHKTMKIAAKQKTVVLQNKTTVNHFPGSAYSLEGCSPAEPSSAVTDETKLSELNQNNKLIYQQLKEKYRTFCQPKS